MVSLGTPTQSPETEGEHHPSDYDMCCNILQAPPISALQLTAMDQKRAPSHHLKATALQAAPAAIVDQVISELVDSVSTDSATLQELPAMEDL